MKLFESFSEYIENLPAKYTKVSDLSEYKQVSPERFTRFAESCETKLKSLNSTEGKPVKYYLNIGTQYRDEEFLKGIYTGMAGLLRIINQKEMTLLSEDEKQSFTRIYKKLSAPAIHPEYNYKDLARWLMITSDVISEEEYHTMSEQIATLLSSPEYAAVPWGTIFLGEIKSENPPEVCTIINNHIQTIFKDDESGMNILRPSVVANENNAVNSPYNSHPFSKRILYEQGGKVVSTVQFLPAEEKKIREEGLTPEQVQKYMLTHTKEEHEHKFIRGDKVAKFIESYEPIKTIYDKLILS